MYTVTVTSELSLWQQLEGMSQRGQSLAGKGLIQYVLLSLSNKVKVCC